MVNRQNVSQASDYKITRAAPLRQKLRVKLSSSLGRRELAPCKPYPALCLSRQTLCKLGTRAAVFESLVKVEQGKRGSNPVSPAPEVDA